MLRSIILAAALFCSTVASAEPVKHGVVGLLHAADMPFVVAREKGMFAKRGVNIAPDIPFQNNATVQVALTTNEINIAGTTSFFNIIQTRHNVKNVLWVRAINNAPGIMLYASDDIKTIADLRGKKVSAGGLNDNTRLFTEIILAQGGLKFEDVNWFWSGSASSRLMALQSKQIEAAILWPPFSDQAAATGHRLIGVTSDYLKIANKGLAVNETWARRNPDIVNKISEALTEASEWLYVPGNLDEAARLLSSYTKASVNESKAGIEFYINRRIYETGNLVYKQDIDYYIDIGRRWNNIKPDNKITYEELLWDMKNFRHEKSN